MSGHTRVARPLAGLPAAAATWTEKARARAERMLPRLAGEDGAPPGLAERLAAQREWSRAYAEELAVHVGRGRVGAGPLACVRSAAHALAWSEELYGLAALRYAEGENTTATKLAELAARLADAGRLHATTAHQLAARQGEVPEHEDALAAFLDDPREHPAHDT